MFPFPPKARTLLLVRRAARSMCTMLGERRFKWRATRHAVQHRWSQCHARAELVGTPVQSLDIAALYEQAQQRRQAGHLILAGSPATVAAPARRGPPRGFLTSSVPHLGHDPGRYFIAWFPSFRVVPQRISACASLCGATDLGCAGNSPERQLGGYDSARPHLFAQVRTCFLRFSNVLAHTETRFDSSSIRRVVRGRRWSGFSTQPDRKSVV